MNSINRRILAIFSQCNPSKSIIRSLPKPTNRSPSIRFSHSNASLGTGNKKVITDENGKVVLYRGPPAMKPWIYYFIGGTFVVIGFELAHDIYYHFTWPLFSKDPNVKPELVSERKRTIGAIVAGTMGLITASLFFMVPSSNITRLTLDLPKRQLILRTAIRGFSALPPRSIYPTALRRTAELRGYYLTPYNNERIVPLASVYRVRGSASPLSGHQTGSGSQKTISIRQKGSSSSKTVQQLDIPTHHKQSIEIKVATGRFWYTIEAFGGVPVDQSSAKSKSSRYARFWQRISYWMRGYTDWNDLSKEEMEVLLQDLSFQNKDLSPLTSLEKYIKLGSKQPWFSDRQTFDDVIPLVKRK